MGYVAPLFFFFIEQTRKNELYSRKNGSKRVTQLHAYIIRLLSYTKFCDEVARIIVKITARIPQSILQITFSFAAEIEASDEGHQRGRKKSKFYRLINIFRIYSAMTREKGGKKFDNFSSFQCGFVSCHVNDTE